jgi:hypothetical protein
MLLVNRARLDATAHEKRVADLLERAVPGRADLDRFNRCVAYDYSRLRAA